MVSSVLRFTIQHGAFAFEANENFVQHRCANHANLRRTIHQMRKQEAKKRMAGMKRPGAVDGAMIDICGLSAPSIPCSSPKMP